jgi:hypothetical protein
VNQSRKTCQLTPRLDPQEYTFDSVTQAHEVGTAARKVVIDVAGPG